LGYRYAAGQHGSVIAVFFLPRVSLHTRVCRAVFPLGIGHAITVRAALRVTPDVRVRRDWCPERCFFLRRSLPGWLGHEPAPSRGAVWLLCGPGPFSLQRVFFTQGPNSRAGVFWRSAFSTQFIIWGGLFAATRPLRSNAPGRDGAGHAGWRRRLPAFVWTVVLAGCILPGAGKRNSRSSVDQGVIFVAMLLYT
jgi:hypothetical protein